MQILSYRQPSSHRPYLLRYYWVILSYRALSGNLLTLHTHLWIVSSTTCHINLKLNAEFGKPQPRYLPFASFFPLLSFSFAAWATVQKTRISASNWQNDSTNTSESWQFRDRIIMIHILGRAWPPSMEMNGHNCKYFPNALPVCSLCSVQVSCQLFSRPKTSWNRCLAGFTWRYHNQILWFRSRTISEMDRPRTILQGKKAELAHFLNRNKAILTIGQKSVWPSQDDAQTAWRLPAFLLPILIEQIIWIGSLFL